MYAHVSYKHHFCGIFITACYWPETMVNAVIHVDAEMKEASKTMRESISALLTRKEFTSSLSLIKRKNRTFLETRYWRFYRSELFNGTVYDQLEILAKSQRFDYRTAMRVFTSFICASATGNNWTDPAEVNFCSPLPSEFWSVKLHTSQLSTDEYTPLQLPVTGFKATLSYAQICRDIPKTCNYFKKALKG